ncbi:hypothetical protein [Hyperthermus butylicus]|uniref:Uncharacterized protein n=1 Tax=Hyperthermus butylicus (strain DSM 5456 / JCM 9403 / PLM1-5) TaxID=415426 RepID=A2BMU1_HYPBU|nr:hypothetical protein [Hyperthermus butylicus]ABM81302.1 hypothetical protein Hbut_1478 [Hyperthermus butylicus DSM 5456]
MQESLSMLAHRIVVEAVRLGFPVYSRPLGKNKLYVSTRLGSGVFTVRVLENPIDGSNALALSLDPGYEAVILAELGNDKVAKAYLDNVPKAIAMHAGIMSRYEADVWAQRLHFASQGRLQRIGMGLLEWLASPYMIEVALRDRETRLIVAWVNCLTGGLVDATQWQARLDLLGREEASRIAGIAAKEAGEACRAAGVSS